MHGVLVPGSGAKPGSKTHALPPATHPQRLVAVPDASQHRACSLARASPMHPSTSCSIRLLILSLRLFLSVLLHTTRFALNTTSHRQSAFLSPPVDFPSGTSQYFDFCASLVCLFSSGFSSFPLNARDLADGKDLWEMIKKVSEEKIRLGILSCEPVSPTS